MGDYHRQIVHFWMKIFSQQDNVQSVFEQQKNTVGNCLPRHHCSSSNVLK